MYIFFGKTLKKSWEGATSERGKTYFNFFPLLLNFFFRFYFACQKKNSPRVIIIQKKINYYYYYYNFNSFFLGGRKSASFCSSHSISFLLLQSASPSPCVSPFPFGYYFSDFYISVNKYKESDLQIPFRRGGAGRGFLAIRYVFRRYICTYPAFQSPLCCPPLSFPVVQLCYRLFLSSISQWFDHMPESNGFIFIWSVEWSLCFFFSFCWCLYICGV